MILGVCNDGYGSFVGDDASPSRNSSDKEPIISNTMMNTQSHFAGEVLKNSACSRGNEMKI